MKNSEFGLSRFGGTLHVLLPILFRLLGECVVHQDLPCHPRHTLAPIHVPIKGLLQPCRFSEAGSMVSLPSFRVNTEGAVEARTLVGDVAHVRRSSEEVDGIIVRDLVAISIHGGAKLLADDAGGPDVRVGVDGLVLDLTTCGESGGVPALLDALPEALCLGEAVAAD